MHTGSIAYYLYIRSYAGTQERVVLNLVNSSQLQKYIFQTFRVSSLSGFYGLLQCCLQSKLQTSNFHTRVAT